MNIYVASKWARKQEIDDLIPVIEKVGHTVVSTWTKEIGDGSESNDYFSREYQREAAERDLDELGASDVFLLMGESTGSVHRGGGRFVELGYAISLGLPVYVVGEAETIFHELACVTLCGSLREALKRIEMS